MGIDFKPQNNNEPPICYILDAIYLFNGAYKKHCRFFPIYFTIFDEEAKTPHFFVAFGGWWWYNGIKDRRCKYGEYDHTHYEKTRRQEQISCSGYDNEISQHKRLLR